MLAGVQQKLEKLQEQLVAMNFKKLKLEADVDNCEKVVNLCSTWDGVVVQYWHQVLASDLEV